MVEDGVLKEGSNRSGCFPPLFVSPTLAHIQDIAAPPYYNSKEPPEAHRGQWDFPRGRRGWDGQANLSDN